MKKIVVGILFGGKSAEHEISLLSAKNIYEALDKEKFSPVLIGIDKSGWYKSTKTNDIENLDKYIVKNAVSYDDFLDHWVNLETVKDKLPAGKLGENIQQKFIELRDSSFYYFINIQEYLLPGDIEPIEHAESYIREILINQKKADFIRNVESELYDKALNNGKIKFHIE